MSLLILTLFGMTFSLLPHDCDEDDSELCETSVIPEQYRWLRILLEDAMLFFLSLAIVVTLLEMLKELRKKYEWQKALTIFIEKAVAHDFGSSESRNMPIRLQTYMP